MANYIVNQEERMIILMEDGEEKAICDYLLWSTPKEQSDNKHEGLLVIDCPALRAWILENFDFSVDNDGDFIFPIPAQESYEVAI